MEERLDDDVGSMSEETAAMIAQTAEWCFSARHLVVLTGAGVSAESGVPTFRDKNGLWDKYDVTTLATPDAFEKDPAHVWKWYDWRRQRCAGVGPNAGHYAIVELERDVEERGGRFTLITQNIDNLHNVAGSRNVLELHGNIWKVRLAGTSPDDISVREHLECPIAELPPRDEHGRLLRPHIIWFGEMLSPAVIQGAQLAAQRADVMIVAGTANVVYPSASLPYMVLNRGGKVVNINPGVSELSGKSTLTINEKSGVVLPALVNEIRRLRGDQGSGSQAEANS